MAIKQFQICVPKQDLIEKKGGALISKGSNVVVVDLLKNGHALVCRYGNYLDSMITDVKLLEPTGK